MTDKTQTGANVKVGIGINDPEAPNTPVAASVYADWNTFTLQPNVPRIFPETARGVRNLAHSGRAQRRFSSGSLGVPVDPEIAPVLWALILGNVTTAEIEEGEVWEHTMKPVENIADFLQATYRVSHGDIVDEIYNKVAAQNGVFEFQDGFASLTTELRGDFPDAGSEVVPSFTAKRRAIYGDAEARFGATLAAATSADHTPLRQFSLTVENNLDEDGAFESGNDARPNRFYPQERVITGQYTLRFQNVDEYNRYKNSETRALELTVKGESLPEGHTADMIIKLDKISYTDQPVQREINNVMLLQQQFRAEIDGGSDISVTFKNDHDGTFYHSAAEES